MELGNLRKPVRNAPPQGTRHQCSLIVTKDANGNDLPEPIDLHSEVVCRQNNLDNGMIFTCEDIVTVAGKTGPCGKEWVLHYPTIFAWKIRRSSSDATATASSDGATAETVTEAPAASKAGRRK